MERSEGDLNMMELYIDVSDAPLRNPLINPIEDPDTREQFLAVVRGSFVAFRRAFRGNANLKHPSGFRLIHFAIFHKRRDIFRYLLHRGADVEKRTPTYDDTCLGWLLSQSNVADERFICDLIKRGADVNCKFFHYAGRNGADALILAFERQYVQAAKLMIRNGFDMSSSPSEKSYAESLFDSKISSSDKYDIISLMISHGYVISCEDFFMSVNEREHELVVLLSDFIADVLPNVEIPLYTLTGLMNHAPTIFERLKTKVTKIERELPFDAPIFSIPPNALLWLIQNFPKDAKYWLKKQKDFRWKLNIHLYMDTFKILLKSPLRRDFLALSGGENFRSLLHDFIFKFTIPQRTLHKFMVMMLRYGVPLFKRDIQKLFYRFDFSHLFIDLLMYDVTDVPGLYVNKSHHMLPSLICDMSLSIEKALRLIQFFYNKSLDEMLPFCSRPILVNHCKKNGIPIPAGSVAHSSGVPSLTELARDAAREHIKKKYNARNFREFYTALNKLPISSTCKDIIILKTPLYEDLDDDIEIVEIEDDSE